MAERRTHPNGGVYERGQDGQWHLVSSAPAIGPAIGNDPRIPGTLQGQQFSNQKAAVDAHVSQATQNAQIRQANAQASKAETEARTAQIEGGNPAFDREKELRSAFEAQPAVRAYKDAATSLGVILQTPDTGGGDIQVIYNYIKSQGPGPVAQGELDLAQSVASFQESLEQKYGKLTSSNRLPPRVRRELIEASRQAVAAKRAQFDQVYEQFRIEAARNKLNPESVTGRHPADAVRPAEEKYIRDAGGLPKSRFAPSASPPPSVSLTPDGRAILQDTGRGTIQQDTGIVGEDGGFHMEADPRLAGANAAINAMLKGGAPDKEIASFLSGRGAEPAAIADIMGKVQQVRAFQRRNPGFKGDYNIDIERREIPNSGYQNFMNSDVGTGLSLGANALAGGIPGILADKSDEIAAARGAHPKSAFAGEVAGAIGGTVGLNKALGRVPGLAQRPTARLAATDALYGGTYGATQNPDDPLKGAALGAGAGLAGNVLGSRVVAPAFRGAASQFGYNPAPAMPRGQSLLAGQAQKAGPQDVMGQLQSAADLNMPLALVDAAPQLRALGGSVTRKSPDAFALANEQLGSRTLGQVDRLTGVIEGELGPRLNLPTFKEGVKKSAQVKSRPLYESAKGQAPVDDQLVNEMLQTPAGQRAARSGYDEAINNGEPVGDLVEEVDSITGQIRLVGRPSWHVLQRMKFALDEMPDQANLARRFNSQLGKLNPDFRKANLTYAKEMRRGDIAEAGYGGANPNVRPPELGASMTSPTNMKDPGLFKQGYGSNLVDKARGMRDSANPYEVASMASPDQLAKMHAVSPGLHGKFGQARGVENQMSLTNKELFGGSPTASRMEADKLFEGGMGDAALDLGLSVASGTPPINAGRAALFAGRAGFGGLRDAWRLGGRGAKQMADELAPTLFNPDPRALLEGLEEMLRAKSARDEYVRRTGMFGAGIGAPLTIGYTAGN